MFLRFGGLDEAHINDNAAGAECIRDTLLEENVSHRRPVLEHQDYDVGVSHSVDRGVHDTGPEGCQDTAFARERFQTAREQPASSRRLA